MPTAAISITCSPAAIDVPVYPNANATGTTTCTASNPTQYEEKVAISGTADGFQVESINELIIPANSESDFEVTVLAPDGHEFLVVQSRSLVVQGSVQEIGGSKPSNVATSGASMILNVMQYIDFSITENNSIRPVNFWNQDKLTEKEATVNVELKNEGNGMDFIKIGIEENSRNLLEAEGFKIGIPKSKIRVQPFEPSSFNFTISLTNEVDYSEWILLNNGSKLLTRNITIFAESDFACSNEDCDTQLLNMELEIYLSVEEDGNNFMIYLVGGLVVCILSIILVVVFFVTKNNIVEANAQDFNSGSFLRNNNSNNTENGVKPIPVINLGPPVDASVVQDEYGSEWIVSEDGTNWYRV